MALKNSIKNRLMKIFLYLTYLVNKAKVFLGLLELKHSLYGYFEYKGSVFTKCLVTPQRLEACEKYDHFRSDDVILCTYPKAGTHFTAGIIESIYKENSITIATSLFEMQPSFKRFLSGAEFLPDLHSAQSPRLFITHLSFEFLPEKVKNGQVKVIHCMRNPKDVVCSYFPFINNLRVLSPDTTFNEFVMNFITGNVFFGSYFKFLKEWYPYRNNKNVLNLQFEDMKKDLDGNVRRVAEFLGVSLTDEQILKIANRNTFANKKKEMGSGHVVYRKGKSGGWKSELTVEQNEMFDEWIQSEMEGMEDLTIQYD